MNMPRSLPALSAPLEVHAVDKEEAARVATRDVPDQLSALGATAQQSAGIEAAMRMLLTGQEESGVVELLAQSGFSREAATDLSEVLRHEFEAIAA